MMAAHKKVIVLGMDGATWRIMNPLLATGKLPNLQGLCETGTSGTLKSIEPLVSPAIWTSIASGKEPDKHGVWDFVVASNSVRCKRIWDLVSESGMKVGLCGYMVTWPPPAVNGFVIPGSFSRGPETLPTYLQPIREIDMMQRTDNERSLIDQVELAWQCHRLGVGGNTFVAAALAKLRSKINKDFFEKFYRMRKVGLQWYTDVFIEQTRRFQPHLAMYVFTLVDSTSHNYWKFMEPERFDEVDPDLVRKHRTKIHQAYQAADRVIGRTLAKLDDGNTFLFVVSDHGFQSVPEAQGRAPDRTVRIKPEALAEMLSWDKEAVRTFNIRGATYFRDRNNDESKIRRMQQELAAIKIVGTDLPLFDVALDPFENIEIRIKDEVGDLEGLSVQLANSRVISASQIVEGDIGLISGDHHPDGVLIAAGPGIRRGAKVDRASVLDITPTLLALLGLPVGRDMDGRVLCEMFEPGSISASPVEYVDTWEQEGWRYDEDTASADENLKEQLRSLGYL